MIEGLCDTSTISVACALIVKIKLANRIAILPLIVVENIFLSSL